MGEHEVRKFYGSERADQAESAIRNARSTICPIRSAKLYENLSEASSSRQEELTAEQINVQVS